MNVRNSYLISHAFRNYLWASLLSSAGMQMTVTADAIVMGQFIGADALSAINLVMPLTMLVSALSTLIGLGPAIMASKAIGNRKFEKVNMVFTSAIFQAIIIGGFIGIVTRMFSQEIASLLCHNEHLLPYLTDYLQVLSWCFSLTILVSTLVSLTEADGHPKLATKALLVGSLSNVLLDILFVGYGGMGIQGAAWAMLVNHLLVITVFAFWLKREGVSYQWQWPKKNILNVTLAGLKEGTPMMVNDLLYSLMLFLLNSLVLASLGEEGLYHWALCMQVLMLVLVVVDGAEGAVLSIGSMLIGEKDRRGFYMLLRRLLLLIVVVVGGIALVACIFPEGVAKVFDEEQEVSAGWPSAVRIFSLMLVPHALSIFLRCFFQVLGFRLLGVVFSLLQTMGMVLCLWGMTHWCPTSIWWSFPASAFLMLLIQVGGIVYLSRRSTLSRDTFLITSDNERKVIDLSVGYDTKQVLKSIEQVCTFLEQHTQKRMTIMAINICCEELMLNIVRYQSHKHNPYMDLHIAVAGQKINFVLKDAGRPFNPVLPSRDIHSEDSIGEHLGLTMVNSVCTTLSHKYMYGQNVVFAEFKG